MKTDPILNELDGLSPELARFKRASREAQAAGQAAGDGLAPGEEATGDQTDPPLLRGEAERMAKLRAGILARTVGQAAGDGLAPREPVVQQTSHYGETPHDSGPLEAAPRDPNQRTSVPHIPATPVQGRTKVRSLFPRALTAAAVLAAVMVGAWFALQPSAQPCDTILCALDELSDAELAALAGTTITWSSNSDWGLDETEALASAALDAGWLDDLTNTEAADADAWMDEALSGGELSLDDWTWENASLDDLAALGEDLSDAEWDALLFEDQTQTSPITTTP